MKFRVYHLAIFFCFLIISCSTTKHAGTINSLPASSLQPYGRYAFNNQQHVELISSAAHVGFSFEGKECNVFAYILNANEHNYLQYELDGIYQKKIKIEGNNRHPFIITAASNGTHAVWIYKTTEAHTGPIFIEKITGKNLMALKKPEAPLIEFIGNSITCGAAADPSEMPCGTGVYHDQHNAYYAYGPRVARSLGTNFTMSSVSGIGIYRNWNSDGPAMPQVYEKMDFQDLSDRKWNFETYKPAIVSIALGTNDFSGGDGKKQRLPFDSAAFVSSYIKFVQLVKSKYPAAQIALLSSPMLNGDRMTALQNDLVSVKQNIDALYPADKPVALFFFKPMQARGCSGHPNVEDHAILADELIPFFKKLLDYKN
jgi:hypothetical protein